MNRLTLKDMALKLECSESTVSRGLRDDPRLPLKTRKRVQDACAAAGYRRDPLLSELASARWRRAKVTRGSVIAYVNCIVGQETFWDLDVPLREEASLLGYEVRVFNRAAFKSSARLQRTLRNEGITEVILGPVYDEALKVTLTWNHFICVQLLPGLFSSPLRSVVQDHFNGVILAWRKAVKRGYRRIGITLLEHPFQLMDDTMRMSAVYACQKRLFPELAALPPFFFESENSWPKELIEWVEHHRPDVIIGFNCGQVPFLRQELGRDIPYACLHAPDTGELAGLSEYRRICAKEGINLLDFCRRTHQWGLPEQRIDHVIEPCWIEGKSMPWKSA